MYPATRFELQPISENSSPWNSCVGRIKTIKATMLLGQSFAAISQPIFPCKPHLGTASALGIDCIGDSTLVGVPYCRRFNSPNPGPQDSIRFRSDDHSVI